jgi:hypothetical protein
LSCNDGDAIVVDDFRGLKFMLSSGLAENEQCQERVTTVCSSKKHFVKVFHGTSAVFIYF